jgi:peptidoglycan/xylan/chitin deacetylase (PgdA/CDA1 family)
MVRRSWAAAFETGQRPVRRSDAWANLAFRALLPASSAICARTDEQVLSLTFDDGPDPRFTPGVLEALARHDARATFFMLSGAAERHPDLVRAVVDAGHDVALHGVDHRDITSLSPAETRETLVRGRDTLEQVSGQEVHLYRPAYGALTAAQARLAHALDLETVIWSAWATDWSGEPPERVAARARDACHPGAIVLLHDTLADLDLDGGHVFDSPRSTDLLLAQLVGEGWAFLTTEDLLTRHPLRRCAWFQRRANGGP